MLGAGGLAASAGVVLALVLPEAGEEAPSDVAGMVPEPKGVAVLRGVVKMEVAAGVLAEVAWTGKVLCVRWVVGPEETLEGYIRNEERCIFIRLEQWFMSPSMY